MLIAAVMTIPLRKRCLRNMLTVCIFLNIVFNFCNNCTEIIFKCVIFLDPQDNLPGKMGPHGVTRLLSDVRIDPSDRSVLILAWKLNAEVQCEFSKAEWINGMKEIRFVF